MAVQVDGGEQVVEEARDASVDVDIAAGDVVVQCCSENRRRATIIYTVVGLQRRLRGVRGFRQYLTYWRCNIETAAFYIISQ